jgi:predicted metal-dependent HD superfamily phosphohydrolase
MSTFTSPVISLSPQLLGKIELAYATPPRAYHNFTHVHEVLKHFESARSGPSWQHPNEVYVAILFHDAMYVPGRKDNEIKSAQFALESIKEHQLKVNSELVSELILLTAKHGSIEGVSGDTALFLDCDMAILGSNADVFAQYDLQIAREYVHVPKLIYSFNRNRFLTKLLKAPRIFHSDFFHEKYDAQARINLRVALAR